MLASLHLCIFALQWPSPTRLTLWLLIALPFVLYLAQCRNESWLRCLCVNIAVSLAARAWIFTYFTYVVAGFLAFPLVHLSFGTLMLVPFTFIVPCFLERIEAIEGASLWQIPFV